MADDDVSARGDERVGSRGEKFNYEKQWPRIKDKIGPTKHLKMNSRSIKAPRTICQCDRSRYLPNDN